MDVLVVGGGGREHALAWALSRSPSVDKIYCAPGNAGIAQLAECWDIRPGELAALARRADDNTVDLVVVGPEAPLAAGIAEVFEQLSIPCFGPSRAAAILEGSKAFAKAFMVRHAIPTARFSTFSDAKGAASFASQSPWGYPVVVKVDGLAAGKGVVICNDAAAAVAAVTASMVDNTFGAAGSTLVIEEFVRGTEVSIMALSDGTRAVPLLPSQDHKQVLDGDKGPNTGGMGAYAPAYSVIDEAGVRRISEQVLQPTIDGLAAEGRRFAGVLYAGLMLTPQGPIVLEYNCRFGDPEAQAIIPLIDEDFGELLAAFADGAAPDRPLRWTGKHCACVVVAAEGYPGKYRHGRPIRGLENLAGRDDLIVFHGGTSIEQGRLVNSGGRVLGITATAESLDGALASAYEAIDKIELEGMHFRRDIGHRPEPGS